MLLDPSNIPRGGPLDGRLPEGVEVLVESSVGFVSFFRDRRIPVESDQVSIRRLIGVKKDDWLLEPINQQEAKALFPHLSEERAILQYQKMRLHIREQTKRGF